MVAGEGGRRPFVTIGVTTYNRHELLRQTLASVLAQRFTDFEVIVGNDYTDEVLTGEMLGISDPRVRFVNHPVNLREVGNMNALLDMATGRYFTWLFDDDLYHPDYLQIAYDCLAGADFPDAFFCSYRIAAGEELRQLPEIATAASDEFTGREFLRWYSVYKLKLFPTFGLFATEILKERIGGFEEVSNTPIALYSEYLFLAGCGLLDRIVYMDAPLYFYRMHDESWSETNTELEVYPAAGQRLVKRCSEVLASPSLSEDHAVNLWKICSLHLIEFAHKLGRHVHYVSTQVQKEFGFRAACRVVVGHWREALKIRKLYLQLVKDRSCRGRLEFFKVVGFCNYVMASHFFHYFRGGRHS